MRAQDLSLTDLLRTDGGALFLGSARALLVDTLALGWLRKELIDGFGIVTARGLLTRLGYAHGVRMAEAARADFDWDDEGEHHQAGVVFAELMGFAAIEIGGRGAGPEATWRGSYEAEQHLLHSGRGDTPVCWSLCGFASGWFSFARGRDMFFLEDRCVGRGDPTCHVVGRPPEAWGEERAHDLQFFEKQVLDETVARLGEELRDVERKLRRRRRALKDSADDDGRGLVARSTAMRRVLELAERAAPTRATVVVTGESGTGKERVAAFLHERSDRADGPFVAVNCGALTETLLESELFGHKKGAFTGAHDDRPGLFEAAHGGTLLLDEIGEVSPAMQVKLLRVLQERKVRRVGENHDREIDVRIVAATHRRLAAEVEAGRFREDLYYRLHVVEIELPPLRDRREDVLPLAARFLDEAMARVGKAGLYLSSASVDALQEHRWPGNVRELENAIERAVALCRGDEIGPEDLPSEVRAFAPRPAMRGAVRTLHDVEREYVLSVLAKCGGNQTKAAKALGIGTATLYRKLKRWRS